MMAITTQTRALLLLTARLGQATDAVPPLDRPELDRLCAWLKRTRLKPADLLEPELLERLSWAPDAPPLDRLVALLDRSALLDAALDRWARPELWVIGRDDPDYPRRLKRRLRDAAPALLFGRGDRTLLNRGGIAVIGGGGADALGHAERFAARAATVGLSIVSGLRNPVEEAAMLGSLSRRGHVVGVLSGELVGQQADSHLRASVGRLVLVSDAEPGSGGGSTDCVYGVSDAVLLLGVERGGDNWADTVGAIEREWLPHWVRAGDPEAGTLIRLGAHPLDDEDAAPRALLSPPRPARPRRPMPGFIAPAPQPVLAGFAETVTPFPAPPPAGRGAHLRLVETGPRPAPRGPARARHPGRSAPGSPDPAPSGSDFPGPASSEPAPSESAPSDPRGRGFPDPSFYELFGRRIALLLRGGPLGATRIAEAMDLTRPQAEAWLLRAQGEGRIRLDPADRLYHLI